MRMEVSEHGSPVLIRVIRVIRGFFQSILDCIPRAEILGWIPLKPNRPPPDDLAAYPSAAGRHAWALQQSCDR